MSAPRPIRRLEPGDMSAVVDLCNESIRRGESTYGPDAVTADEMSAALLDVPPEFESWVYETDGGEVVGWAALMRHTGRPIYDTIAELAAFVAVERRGQGIGRALVAHALGRASAVGFRALLAIVDPDSAYVMTWVMRRLGFRNVGWLAGVVPFEEGWKDVLVFHKTLSAAGETS